MYRSKSMDVRCRLQARLKSELRFSRDMLRRGVDVVTRLVIQKPPDSQIVVLTNLPASGQKRRVALEFLSDFLAFHMSTSFVLAFQTLAPKMLTAVLVSRDGFAAATQSIHDGNQSFGEIVFHDPRHTDLDILETLPGIENRLSIETTEKIETFMANQEIAPNTYVLEV